MSSSSPVPGSATNADELRDALAAAEGRAGDEPPEALGADLTAMEYEVLRPAVNDDETFRVLVESRCQVLRAAFDLIADARGRGGRKVSYHDFADGMRLPHELTGHPALKSATRVTGDIGQATGSGTLRAATRTAIARYASASEEERIVLATTLAVVTAASFRNLSNRRPLSEVVTAVATMLGVEWP